MSKNGAITGGKYSWYARRRSTLERYGLLEKWGQVPRADRRTKPLAEYLPGGSEYDD